jgi:hypothetical protein
MENNLTTADDLKTIRKIMEDSTKFLSISGFSGLFMGLIALAGALVAYFLLADGRDQDFIMWKLVIDAILVLMMSTTIAFYFSLRKAKRAGKSFWTPVSKRLLLNLFIPLITGGILVVIMMMKGQFLFIIPVLLIFYGLALVNAGKFTYSEVFYLGILEIITGLVSAIFPSGALFFWILGFGILHIVYGLFMYRKYEA